MADQSRSVIEAIDRIRLALGSGGYEYPDIANPPFEQVLAFNNNEDITLKDPDEHSPLPYFSSHGVLTDLQHRVIEGSRVETTFPVDPKDLAETENFPPPQEGPPFNIPPVNNEHTTSNGYSKQAYFFPGDPEESSLVTAGPSLPKIARTKNGGALFLEGSIGVVAQGTGRFKGARGTSVYVGSGYFDKWPKDQGAQLDLLRKGFKALVGTYFKVILKRDLAK